MDLPVKKKKYNHPLLSVHGGIEQLTQQNIFDSDNSTSSPNAGHKKKGGKGHKHKHYPGCGHNTASSF
jgi:hypothetical protein